MIAQLTGKIVHKAPPELIIDVNGVGYKVLCPMSSFYQLTEQNIQTLLTHLIVREDNMSLYGFVTNDEKDLFCNLIKVNGIGAKVALSILSTLSVSELISCINNDDFNTIKTTPGIGLKTAQKLIVELKDKVIALSTGNKTIKKYDNKASQALQSLGFKHKEAKQMLEKIDTNLSTEEIIRLALKNK